LATPSPRKDATVTIRFLDDEIMEGRVGAINLDQPNIDLEFPDSSNNERALIPLPSIKRITISAAQPTAAERERGGKKGPRYTPVSRRQDRPNAILWLVRNHPELKDAAIMRLVGTTKSTIAAIRDRTHWNASTLTPMDPVTLGLCSQIELDFEVQRAAKEKPTDTAYGGATLLPASETTKKEPEFEPSEKQRDDLNVDAVFAKLKTIGGKKLDEE